MIKEENALEKNEISTVENIAIEKQKLDNASLQIITQTIAENDYAKTRDLTHMFNNIQKKKAMVRVDKLNTLLDVITDQAIERFTLRPDELSNQELFQGLKIVQDISEKNQKMLLDQSEQPPLIQINQQEVNIGTAPELDKASRDKVKTAVASVLASIAAQANKVNSDVIADDEYIDVIEGEPNNE